MPYNDSFNYQIPNKSLFGEANTSFNSLQAFFKPSDMATFTYADLASAYLKIDGDDPSLFNVPAGTTNIFFNARLRDGTTINPLHLVGVIPEGTQFRITGEVASLTPQTGIELDGDGTIYLHGSEPTDFDNYLDDPDLSSSFFDIPAWFRLSVPFASDSRAKIEITRFGHITPKIVEHVNTHWANTFGEEWKTSATANSSIIASNLNNVDEIHIPCRITNRTRADSIVEIPRLPDSNDVVEQLQIVRSCNIECHYNPDLFNVKVIFDNQDQRYEVMAINYTDDRRVMMLDCVDEVTSTGSLSDTVLAVTSPEGYEDDDGFDFNDNSFIVPDDSPFNG